MSTTSSKRLPSSHKRILIAGFLLVVGLIMTPITARDTIRAISSSSWPAADGIVTSSGFHGHGKSRRWEVKYKYSVAAQPFEGTKLRFGADALPWERNKVAARYAAGTPVKIHYNPSDPKVSVIQSGIGPGVVFQLILWAVLFFGGLFLFVRERRKWRHLSEPSTVPE